MGEAPAVCRRGAVAARRLVGRRRRRQHALTRVALPAGALRTAVLPAGIPEGIARHLPARLLRLPVLAAVDRRAFRARVLFDAEADLGPADPVPDWPLEGR